MRFYQETQHIKICGIAGSFIAFVYNIFLNYTVYTHHTLSGLNSFFYLDALSILSTQIVTLVGFAAALYSAGYMEAELHEGVFREKKLRWYYFLFHMFIFTMLLVCVSNNLGIMWVAIEATTLATTFLVGFYNKNRIRRQRGNTSLFVRSELHWHCLVLS